MNVFDEDRPAPRGRPPAQRGGGPRRAGWGLAGLILVGLGLAIGIYNACKIEVGTAKELAS